MTRLDDLTARVYLSPVSVDIHEKAWIDIEKMGGNSDTAPENFVKKVGVPFFKEQEDYGKFILAHMARNIKSGPRAIAPYYHLFIQYELLRREAEKNGSRLPNISNGVLDKVSGALNTYNGKDKQEKLLGFKIKVNYDYERDFGTVAAMFEVTQDMPDGSKMFNLSSILYLGLNEQKRMDSTGLILPRGHSRLITP